MTFDCDALARMAWAQLWQVTIVAVAAGVIAKFCCRDRPRLAYALWMLVVVKSIVPPCWSSPTGLFSWALAGRAAQESVFSERPIGPLFDRQAAALPGEDPPSIGGNAGEVKYTAESAWGHLQWAIFSIWTAGFLLSTAFVLAKQIICATLIRKSSVPVSERYATALAQLAQRLGVKRIVRLIVTSRPVGPAAFGLVRPSILMPSALLAGASPEQVELVFAHELIHVRRGDILAGKLQLVAQLVWWFHPLLWWVNREAGRERERCCDGEVVSGVGCKPASYARALLRVVEQKSRLRPLVAIPGVRALEVTSRRLEFIMRYAKTDHRRPSLIARVVFLTGVVMLVPGTGLTLRAYPPVNDKPAETVEADAPEFALVPILQTAPRSEGKATETLDAKARWRVQQLVTRRAAANYHRARLSREVAEIAVLEYEEGIFKQDLATVEGELKLAESDLSRSEDRLAWAERMYKKGYVSKAALTSARQELKKARFALEQAQSKRTVLVEYTKGKTVKELKSEVEKARSNELAKKGTWEQEKLKESALEREVRRSRPAGAETKPH